MATLLEVDVDGRSVERTLRFLQDVPRDVFDEGLNLTAFEIRDAEVVHIGGIFEFAGAQTRQFFGKNAFFIRQSRGGRMEVTVGVKELSAQILIEHLEGGDNRIDPSTERLRVTAPSGRRYLAIPFGQKRGRRGTIPRDEDLPSAVIAPGGRGFINTSESLIMRRRSETDSRLVRAYILVPEAELPGEFDFFGVALRTAEEEFSTKVAQAWHKRVFGQAPRSSRGRR